MGGRKSRKSAILYLARTYELVLYNTVGVDIRIYAPNVPSVSPQACASMCIGGAYEAISNGAQHPHHRNVDKVGSVERLLLFPFFGVGGFPRYAEARERK